MDIRDALAQVLDGRDLTQSGAQAVMEQIMTGQATPAQISGGDARAVARKRNRPDQKAPAPISIPGPAPSPAAPTPHPPIHFDSPGTLPTDADPDLLGDYVAEALDHVQAAESALLRLESGSEDQESINAIFRAFHTVNSY